MKRIGTALAAFGFLVATGTVAKAAPIVFVGSSGALAASASFEQTGTTLTVTLTNTAAGDVTDPAGVLTALFFDIAGAGPLTPVSALLNVGSTVVYDAQGQPPGGNVGGEWAYGAGLAGAPGLATEGISSSGFGVFGTSNFIGPELAGPPNNALDGPQYGVLSAGDDILTGAGGSILNGGGLIKNSVIFKLAGLPAGFILDAGDFSHVSFQYGTGLDEPNVPGTNPTGDNPTESPEPASLILLGSGLTGVAMKLRRRKS